ncbi:hypothetical protein TSMG0130 [Halocynthia phage JM-2012]|uniref:hypothetical protein n=1 Tax=Halocynthia phage JM-2012 TaxID=1173297 RepID=UPI00025C695E|nr:hypothetical protein TSMG0130 [Halocynthia phage JM-2012]AFI55413.1 hypothetical protein TSMG0130 [Halocynthia phage JM-2012]
MSESLLDLAVSNMGMASQTSVDSKLAETELMRQEVLRALLSNSLDPSIATAAKGLLADQDKAVFTKVKLENDKQADQDKTALLNELYMQLVTQGGKEFTMPPIDGQAVEVDPSKKELMATSDDDFNFEPGEMITGNDTEDSVNL